MKNRECLFIAEGIKDEKPFLKKIFEICFKNINTNIYTYDTNVHILANKLFKYYDDFFDEKFENGNIDILEVLKDEETDKTNIDLLSKNYNDIFIIFDCDPQHIKPEFSKVNKLLKFFNNSSEQGQLYINYPMMQSYKHLYKMPDLNFKERAISIKECKNYKKTVNEFHEYQDIKKYDYKIIMSMLAHHLCKCRYIVKYEYEIPKNEGEYSNEDLIVLFENEVNKIIETNVVDIINTSMFSILDYKPKELIDQLNKHKNIFYI